MKVQILNGANFDTKALCGAVEGSAFVEQCYDMSNIQWVGVCDGEVCCIMGGISLSLLSETVYLWLLTTEAAKKHEFIIARYSQIYVEKLLEMHPVLIGHCHVSHTRSIRWLRWLGATFGEATDKLVPFRIEKKHG